MTEGLIRAVIKVEFPQASPQGREQIGLRPAVVVGVPDLVAPPRFGGLVVVPFSSRVDRYAGLSRDLYPVLLSGAGGLTMESVALCEQVRFLGRERIRDYLGHLTPQEFEPIDAALRRLLGH